MWIKSSLFGCAACKNEFSVESVSVPGSTRALRGVESSSIECGTLCSWMWSHPGPRGQLPRTLKAKVGGTRGIQGTLQMRIVYGDAIDVDHQLSRHIQDKALKWDGVPPTR